MQFQGRGLRRLHVIHAYNAIFTAETQGAQSRTGASPGMNFQPNGFPAGRGSNLVFDKEFLCVLCVSAVSVLLIEMYMLCFQISG
jgi:hypothetical protein